MSSYATVYLSDGSEICTFRNGVDELFFLLFTRQEWVEFSGDAALPYVRAWFKGPPEEARVTGFLITARALRDRLDVLDVTLDELRSEFARVREEAIDLNQSMRGYVDHDELAAQSAMELAALQRLSWEAWIATVHDDLSGPPRQLVDELRRRDAGEPPKGLSFLEGQDPRLLLRAAVEVLADETEIVLDLADLLDGGYLEPDVDPRDYAEPHISYTMRGGLVPIVLTEGRFDADVLAALIRIRRPHLAGYLRFPDFSTKNEGGAAALRQTVRAFAAAGIPNRVVALFDADTAAQDVLRSWDRSDLPKNLHVTQLPPLDLASKYPTRGPQGHHQMDVNGLACSIEMYLGVDVLNNGSGLHPVDWRGHVRSLNAYQGELSDKRALQEAFWMKVRAAESTPSITARQDWAGLDLVLDHLLGELRTASD